MVLVLVVVLVALVDTDDEVEVVEESLELLTMRSLEERELDVNMLAA